MSYWTIMSSVTAKEATSCKNLRTSSHRQDRDCVSTCLCPFSELWLDVLTIAEGTQTPCTVIFRVKDRVWLLSLDCCRVCLTYLYECNACRCHVMCWADSSWTVTLAAGWRSMPPQERSGPRTSLTERPWKVLKSPWLRLRRVRSQSFCYTT